MTAQQPQGAPNTTGSVSTDTANGPDPYRATQGANVAAEICGDELTEVIRCQSPKWRCLVQDHGWSDGRRTITWKPLAATPSTEETAP